MKHKHKWILKYVDAGTLGKGLLYFCTIKGCNSCKELKSDNALNAIHEAYRNEISRLEALLTNKKK